MTKQPSSDTLTASCQTSDASRTGDMFILQKFVWATESTAVQARDIASWISGRPKLAQTDNSLTLDAGDYVDFDTMANALDHRKWSSFGSLQHIALRVSGQGSAKVVVLDLTRTGAARVVRQVEIVITDDPLTLDLGDPTCFGAGRLALSVTAKTTLVLKAMEWVSSSPAPVAGVVWPSANGPSWVLQNFIWPDASRADRTALYAKWPDGMPQLSTGSGLSLPCHEKLDLITFFNAFSHRKWARLTGIRDLTLKLTGVGSVRLMGCALRDHAISIPIFSHVITLGDQPVEVPLGDPTQIVGELIGIEIIGLSEGASINSASWITREPPRRAVRLAAVITTFKREAAAEAAIRRFSSETIPGVGAAGLELLVVDNGQTLSIPAPFGVRIIPNRNLGGAGGFTRGLIEAQDSGRFSHVLFMDDDASCEPESVWRTIALLAHMGDERASVAGAMLLADDPCVQFEKGAKLNLDQSTPTPWTALNAWQNLEHRAPLTANDADDEANYGGWWYFAFPISAARHLPFPFFVRGDDTDFAVNNDLPVVTLNGVASWCENFGYKLNPVVEYLAWRSWLALSFMHTSAACQKRSLRYALRYSISLGMRFDYAGMEAVLDGIQGSLAGPDHFGDEPAPLAALAKIKKRSVDTPIAPTDLADVIPVYQLNSRWWRIIAFVTLGGHLLPNKLLRPNSRHAKFAWDAEPTTLIRAPSVIFGTGANSQLRRRDRGRFFRGLLRAMSLAVVVVLRRKAASDSYEERSKAFRSRGYWDRMLGLSQEINAKE